MIQGFGKDPVHDRKLFFAAPERVEDWLRNLDSDMRDFVLFLALDGRALSDEAIDSFAKKLLRQGVANVAAWGPGCERVHDLFDVAIDKYRPYSKKAENHVITTWHDDESLDEALWGAIWAAILDEAYIESCNAVLAVAVGNLGWAEQLRKRLSDPRSLDDLVSF